jgi:hypothetical protein
MSLATSISSAPLPGRHRERRIAGRDEVPVQHDMLEDLGGRPDGMIGRGRVEVNDAAGLQVIAAEVAELGGKQVRHVIPEMKGRVHQDEVEFRIRISVQPAAAVVDHAVHFRVHQNRANFGIVQG